MLVVRPERQHAPTSGQQRLDPNWPQQLLPGLQHCEAQQEWVLGQHTPSQQWNPTSQQVELQHSWSSLQNLNVVSYGSGGGYQ